MFIRFEGQVQRLRHADENGGDWDQAAAKPGFSSEGNPYKKNENSADLAHYFPENGGIIPRTLKNGGTRPPRPPCGGAPGQVRSVQFNLFKKWLLYAYM